MTAKTDMLNSVELILLPEKFQPVVANDYFNKIRWTGKHANALEQREKSAWLTWLWSQALTIQKYIASYLLGKQNSWVASDNPAGVCASAWLEVISILLKGL